MMFQNGMISFQCSTKRATRDDWHIEMVRQVEPIQVNRQTRATYVLMTIRLEGLLVVNRQGLLVL